MGYIQIPKLVGGGDEPVINVREMPDEWKYFTTLKESSNDQAYLFYKNKSSSFTLASLATNATVTIYGGSNGTTPLYQYIYKSSSSQRKWYHWDSSTSAWVVNTTQGTSTQNTNCKLTYADLTNYPLPYGLSFYDLTGKPVTNDEHIGTTELFTVIVHNPSGAAASNLLADSFYGGTTSTPFAIPLIAYSGHAKGIKTTSTNLYDKDLEFVEILDGTTINNYQFGSNQFLGKITIPNTVTSLGNYAFILNKNLQEVTLGSGVTALPISCFDSCYNLKKITLKGQITTIGDYAFTDCYSLKELTLPNTVTTFGIGAFQNSGIKNLVIPSTTTFMDSYTFQNSDIENIEFKGTDLQFYENTFYQCNKLEKIILPSQLTKIPIEFCSECVKLKNINFPSTLTEIGDSAFYGTGLEEVTLTGALQTLGDNVFDTCYDLKKVVFPNSITNMGSNIFNNCSFLESANIPTGLIEVPYGMFYGCYNLKNIEIPEGIETISGNAFYKCFNIRQIELPSTVNTINANAFASCGNTLYIKLKSTTAPTLANVNAFASGNTYIKILVPYNSINSYQTSTNWSSTTNNIKSKQRGYGTFTQGATLPSTDGSGNYTLTWYQNLDDVLKTTAAGTPTATPITVAPYDGEFYCTIA